MFCRSESDRLRARGRCFQSPEHRCKHSKPRVDPRLAQSGLLVCCVAAPTPAHCVTKLAVAHCGAALAAVGAPTTTVPASAVTASTETTRDLNEIFIIRVPSQALLDACMLTQQQGQFLNQLCRRCTYHHLVSMHRLVHKFQSSNQLHQHVM